ncbi:D-amino acid dehydrogenase [Vibrio sp. TRT 21S02]|uniref:D-amino acid dehydrogenase n=1 Tax=Vibrio sp. TRT 21S02 TaxID=3418507 RepID=UPI003CF9E53F
MKVVVLGSGVIGLTSAWYLTQAGYEVTVIDRQPRSGEETSFANAGQISYGYSSPWAAPGIPIKAIRWLLEEHAPLKIKPSLNPQMLHWAMQMLSNCTLDKYRQNKSRMLEIANLSRYCLTELKQKYDLQFEGREKGTLQLFRTEAQLAAIEKDISLLQESHTRSKLLDVNRCLEQEPGLAPVKDKLVGGLYLPDDETGDCYLFCQQITQLAQAAGVEFLFDTQIEQLKTKNGKISEVITNKGSVTADAYVVAMGSYSTQLLKSVGINIPVYPVKGYSLTLPITNEQYAPQSTIMDETYKVALTRFEQRLRVAGTAELAGFDPSLPDKRLATINHVVRDLFPDGVDFTRAEYWTGFRPMTPDGPPIIGRTTISNLYTNTGHGTLGWTMACGSGYVLAEVISELSYPKKRYVDLNISRYYD